ncbi:MAG: polynucleotide kinase-phosphatase [Clostridiales Family XIII bacterium]|jgi:protein phosphatase|nr:polynucleotide kinase-phosphatase [Clostridiales Family XIII bacterium]
MTHTLKIPELSLVVLIGASGSGKSTFAKKHFLPTEVISSDHCRALVSDDESSMEATSPAFELLHEIARQRLRYGRLAVIDATNVRSDSRKPLIELAREHDCLAVAIVLDLPERDCRERNRNRADRTIPDHAVRNHCRQLRSSIKRLKKEGFRSVHVLKGADEIDEAEIVRQPLWSDRRNITGPFDVIGDIHGCFDELVTLLEKLGYRVFREDGRYSVAHAGGRIPVFLGDIADRGPKILDSLSIVMDLCESGQAMCVCGNHDAKLLKKLNGKDVRMTHGLDRTVSELLHAPEGYEGRLKSFLDGLISHYVLDGGNLVVAHAGLIEDYQGRSSRRVREFCLYGDTTGETDEYGLPVLYDWANDYRGKALVVYGHVPVPEERRCGRTVCVDTGCVFGGKLTAYRYPEDDVVSISAAKEYYAPIRPVVDAESRASNTAIARSSDIPDISDVLGKRVIETRLAHSITIHEENAMAALETMSRFAADPRWLIYLPPTMSPCETSAKEGLLEHPIEAFSYYGERGVGKVVCERKHMGSRAVVIVCKDGDVAKARFGVGDKSSGICYTRTGRRFFDDRNLEEEFLSRLRENFLASGLFDEFDTGWVCLDCELMPWSAKAQGLLERQYAPTGVAGRQGLKRAVGAISCALERGYDSREVGASVSGQSADLRKLLNHFQEREAALSGYVDAYREYCWPVESLDDVRLAPFHLLATEGMTHTDKDHIWHMETISKYCVGEDCGENKNNIVIATPYLIVDTISEDSIAEGVAWWEKLTAEGGEGMVVKPLDFIAEGKNGRVQPAVKCRGAEYLRIIYGPEYLLPENLPRLKSRSLGRKRLLALREFALGIESLERFCRKEAFYRVHECVFGVLAMESEPVDPRL